MPSTQERRRELERAVADYAARERLVPPLTAGELAAHARCAASAVQASADELPYVSVLLNNTLWADVVAVWRF